MLLGWAVLDDSKRTSLSTIIGELVYPMKDEFKGGSCDPEISVVTEVHRATTRVVLSCFACSRARIIGCDPRPLEQHSRA